MSDPTLIISKDESVKEGARITRGGVVFTSSLADYARSFLILVHKGKEIAKIPLAPYRVSGTVCSVFVQGLPAGTGYYYLSGTIMETDPYAFLVRAGICYPAPEGGGTSPLPEEQRPAERIYYKLHVRGYTKADTGISKELRGTFAGLKEKLDYIKSLGITSIILMPVYACDRTLPNRKTNYWGYAQTNYYFSPEPMFAGDDPAAETVSLFEEIHARGLEAIPEFYFPDDKDPFLVREALRHWAGYYGADGFLLRGDRRMIRYILQDGMLRDRVMIIGSGSARDYGDLPARDLRERKFLDGVFMKGARELLRGTEGSAPAFTSYYYMPAGQGRSLVRYVTDHDGFTLRDLVSYDEKHNEENGENNTDGTVFNFSWNCGKEGATRSKKIRELRKAQARNLLTYLMMAPGDVMLLAGDEFGNTQNGNNNAYCADNATGWLDWKKAQAESELTDFVRQLVKIRRSFLQTDDTHAGKPRRMVFPGISLHSKRAFYTEEDLPAGAVLTFNDEQEGTERSVLYMAINAHTEPYEFALPPLPHGLAYGILLCTADEALVDLTSDALTIPAHSVVLLKGKTK